MNDSSASAKPVSLGCDTAGEKWASYWESMLMLAKCGALKPEAVAGLALLEPQVKQMIHDLRSPAVTPAEEGSWAVKEYGKRGS